MTEEIRALAGRLSSLFNGDHKRGCEGRTYSCDCGYDPDALRGLNDASTALTALVDALEATEQPLAHASQCLDSIVSMDDEDASKDGGSATCQAVKKTVDRALKRVRSALSER